MMTFSEIADCDNAQLSAMANDTSTDPQALMFVHEEQILRGISGVARSLLADIFVNPNAYSLPFDDAAMIAQTEDDDAGASRRRADDVRVKKDLRFANVWRQPPCDGFVR